MAPTKERVAREVVGIFHDADQLDAAISELTSSGFDRSDLSLLARENLLDEDPPTATEGTRRAADDPDAPREAVTTESDVRQSRTLLTSLAGVVAAFAASGAVVLTGGAAAAAIAAAAAAGGGAGLVGNFLGRKAGESEATFLQRQIDLGGILLWVRTRDPAMERQALDILSHHAATDVHGRDLPASPRT